MYMPVCVHAPVHMHMHAHMCAHCVCIQVQSHVFLHVGIRMCTHCTRKNPQLSELTRRVSLRKISLRVVWELGWQKKVEVPRGHKRG